MGKGAIDSRHPLYLGNVGIHGGYAPNVAITDCDVMISIGTRFNDRITGKLSTFAQNCKIIHIDVDAASIYKNIKVIALTVYEENVSYADETIKNASPSEWMWYIKNAQFVFTDSFHGEVFSIKFNKDFYVYYVEENRASRIIDLSHLFHVEDRMITNVEDINGSFKKQIDKEDFKKAKKASLSYLKEIK